MGAYVHEVILQKKTFPAINEKVEFLLWANGSATFYILLTHLTGWVLKVMTS